MLVTGAPAMLEGKPVLFSKEDRDTVEDMLLFLEYQQIVGGLTMDQVMNEPTEWVRMQVELKRLKDRVNQANG